MNAILNPSQAYFNDCLLSHLKDNRPVWEKSKQDWDYVEMLESDGEDALAELIIDIDGHPVDQLVASVIQHYDLHQVEADKHVFNDFYRATCCILKNLHRL